MCERNVFLHKKWGSTYPSSWWFFKTLAALGTFVVVCMPEFICCKCLHEPLLPVHKLLLFLIKNRGFIEWGLLNGSCNLYNLTFSKQVKTVVWQLMILSLINCEFYNTLCFSYFCLSLVSQSSGPQSNQPHLVFCMYTMVIDNSLMCICHGPQWSFWCHSGLGPFSPIMVSV